MHVQHQVVLHNKKATMSAREVQTAVRHGGPLPPLVLPGELAKHAVRVFYTCAPECRLESLISVLRSVF